MQQTNLYKTPKNQNKNFLNSDSEVDDYFNEVNGNKHENSNTLSFDIYGNFLQTFNNDESLNEISDNEEKEFNNEHENKENFPMLGQLIHTPLKSTLTNRSSSNRKPLMDITPITKKNNNKPVHKVIICTNKY